MSDMEEHKKALLGLIKQLEDEPEMLSSLRGKHFGETITNIEALLPPEYSDRRTVALLVISHWLLDKDGIGEEREE